MRVILADDAVLFREGVARILTEAGIDVVAQVGTASDLMAVAASLAPDAVVVDIRMPPTQTTEGLEAAARLREAYPALAVLVLSAHLEEAHALDLLADRRGRIGYLLKERITEISALQDGLKRLMRGEAVIDPEVVTTLLGRRRKHNPVDTLSKREREILALMAEGRSNQGIGQALFVTGNTVETHIRNIFMKLGLLPAADDHRRVLAVLRYLGSKSSGPSPGSHGQP